MKKIEFVNGATIDGAKTFNDMQSNVEEVFNGEEAMGSIRVGNIECKNLLKNMATSKTQNGVTFTVNPDGSVHVSGTATEDTFLRVVDGGWVLPTGTYTLSGGYFNAGSFVACQILHSDGTYNSFAVRSSGWREFEFLEGDVIQFVQIRVGNGSTIDFTFKPQVEKGTIATEYTPYKNFEGRVDVITGQECPTNEYVDGKRVFVKRINFGNLPNTAEKTVAHGLSNFELEDIIATFKSDYRKIKLPVSSPTSQTSNIYIAIDNTNIVIITGSDYSPYSGYVKIYYTKTDTSSTMMYSPRPTTNGDETTILEDEITTLEETLEEI